MNTQPTYTKLVRLSKGLKSQITDAQRSYYKIADQNDKLKREMETVKELVKQIKEKGIEMETTHITCRKCGETKRLDEYYRRWSKQQNKHYYDKTCMECNRKKMIEYNNKNETPTLGEIEEREEEIKEVVFSDPTPMNESGLSPEQVEQRAKMARDLLPLLLNYYGTDRSFSEMVVESLAGAEILMNLQDSLVASVEVKNKK